MKANRGNRLANRIPPFNNNRGPGGANRSSGPGPTGRSSGLLGMPSSGSGGPLMTEHLQLQDLDLELALLRRKREIIEQQQTMLINDKPYNRPSEYDPPSLFSQQSYNPSTQYGQVSNFSRLYEPAYQGDSNGPNDEPYRHGLKRSAPIDPWQSGPLKRLGAKDRLGPAPRPMHPVPEPLMRETYRPPKPVLNSSGTRRLPSLMGRIGFVPNKAVKPKLGGVNKPGNRAGARSSQGSAPNKLNSYPQSVRQNLVSKASDLTQKSYKEEKLEVDKPVSRSLTGRLELALGTVFKDMKAKYGEAEPNAGIFRNNPQQRALKQAIRERIRNVMLGKNVGNAAEITKTYRDKYPAQHDEELLQLALKAGPQRRILPFKATITEDPAKFFKANFDMLLGKQLDKIFAEVSKVIQSDTEIKKPMQDTVEAFLVECGITDDPNKVGKPVEKVNGEAAEEEAKEGDENVENNAGESKNNDSRNENADAIGNTDTDSVEANAETKDTQDKTLDTTKVTNDSNSSTLQDKEEKVENNPEWYKHKFYGRIFDSLCKRRLPVILPKYKDTIIHLLYQDAEFKMNSDIIKEETMKLSEEYKEKAKDGATGQMETKAPAEKKPSGRFPYFVKVLGRPSLPKRKLMQTFLDQFHPKTIKKHRGIHNLLFVGFSDKQDFDNILAATMTVVGNSTIEVRVSEATKSANTNEAETVQTNENMQVKAEFDDDVLNESLDNQIIDLLTSIREEEETKNSEANADNAVKPDTTEANTETESAEAAEVESKIEIDEVKTESNGEAEIQEAQAEVKMENKNVEIVKNEEKDTGKATPTKASARIATSTPASTIRTRRASKMAQN